MKQIIIALLAAASITASAAPTILIGSLVTVNGTSNSQSVALSPATVSFSTFSFQNGGLTSTNAVTLNIQMSTDNTNFNTIGTYTFAQTNSGAYSYYQTPTNIPVYLRVQAVTTNATQLGGTYGN